MVGFLLFSFVHYIPFLMSSLLMKQKKNQCGRNHVAARQGPHFNFNTAYGPAREVNGSTFYGLEMSVALSKWTAGENETACVTEAVRKASYVVDLSFTNGGCYFREGTLKWPVQPR